MSTTQAPQDTEPPAQREGWWRRQTTTARILVITLPVLVLVLLAAVFTRPSPAPTTPGTGVTPQRANACLGGATDLNTAVQYAQATAPLTGTGAAEFAATLVRWSNAAPDPTPAEKDQIMPQLVTREALPSFPATPANQTVNGIRGDATAVGGYYRVDSATPTSAAVSLVMPFTITQPGRAPESRTIWGTYSLAAIDGVWRLAGVPTQADRAGIEQNGQPFQGSC